MHRTITKTISHNDYVKLIEFTYKKMNKYYNNNLTSEFQETNKKIYSIYNYYYKGKISVEVAYQMMDKIYYSYYYKL